MEMAAPTRAISQAGALSPAESTLQGEMHQSVRRDLYYIQELLCTPSYPRDTFSAQLAHSSESYQPTAPMVLSLREISDGNQGTIRVQVLFSMSNRSLAEDKLGSFPEDSEFSQEFTQLMRSFDFTWGDFHILSHCCTPEKE